MANPEYRTIFPKKHTFLAVVHVEGGAQALRNARIAHEGGADGIFLINHSIDYRSLIECYEMVKKELPKFWIGLNCLDIGIFTPNFIPKTTEGLWVDNAGIDESVKPVSQALKARDVRGRSGWHGLYFGGVAFKYQTEIKHPGQVAQLAIPFVDVITTSGAGTGMPADIGKIKMMKKAIGDHPLAIASGVSPENVQDYKPYADCFLVATEISDSHTELNLDRVKKLSQKLKT